MTIDIQRLHEEDFEAERRHEAEMRFKPEVLENLQGIEMRLAQIESDSSSMEAALADIRAHLATAVDILQGSTRPAVGLPKWAVYAVTILLVIIAFK